MALLDFDTYLDFKNSQLEKPFYYKLGPQEDYSDTHTKHIYRTRAIEIARLVEFVEFRGECFLKHVKLHRYITEHNPSFDNQYTRPPRITEYSYFGPDPIRTVRILNNGL